MLHRLHYVDFAELGPIEVSKGLKGSSPAFAIRWLASAINLAFVWSASITDLGDGTETLSLSAQRMGEIRKRSESHPTAN